MTSKKKTSKKSSNKKKSNESLRKAVIATTQANIARIEASERGEPLKPKAKRTKEPKAKRVSALDAAASVLVDTKEPMDCKALIAEMERRNLWKSPGGKTPHATLYAAMNREIAAKGAEARFKKTDRGMFAAAA